MKDEHTVGRKMARNSRKIAILLLLFVLNQTINVVTIFRTPTVSGIALEMKLRKKWNAKDLKSENWLQISKDEIFKIGFKHCSAFPLQERVQLNAIVH